MKYYIFDFNGTILDDVDVCIKAENMTIKRFNLNRKEMTKEEYLKIFTFPVKQYYENVGFDFKQNSYEEIGAYWFDCYCSLKEEYKVFDGVIDILKRNHENKNQNILLSASSYVELIKQLKELKIEQYFDEVLGIDNIYAGSKTNIAKTWMENKNPDDCLMIGDTLHDLEVANEMNIKCYLVAKGHQAKEILLKHTKDVYDDIRDIKL